MRCCARTICMSAWIYISRVIRISVYHVISGHEEELEHGRPKRNGVSPAEDDRDNENPDLLSHVVQFAKPYYLCTNVCMVCLLLSVCLPLSEEELEHGRPGGQAVGQAGRRRAGGASTRGQPADRERLLGGDQRDSGQRDLAENRRAIRFNMS